MDVSAPKAITRRRLRVLALALAILGALLAGALALPGWAQRYAEQTLAEATGGRARIAALGLDPLRLALRVDGLYLTDPQGALLVAADRISANLAIDSAWTRSLHLDALSIQGLRGQLGLLEGGGMVPQLPMGDSSAGGPPPRVRIEPLSDSAVPAVQTHLIEAFLSEPVIVDEAALLQAPRIVAAPETRVLITRGDRAYVRGPTQAPLQRTAGATEYRVFRNARPIKDPVTGVVLGYEAPYLGKASLVRGETVQAVRTSSGAQRQMPVPATIDIVSAKEEMRVGDRLLPEPPRVFTSYVPHAPASGMEGTIVSIYGEAVAIAGQSQVVLINKGTADGIESGHVFAILKSGDRRVDRSQPGERTDIKLPDERNGLLMVFRPFEKLSYALILEISDTVQVGDRIASPQ